MDFGFQLQNLIKIIFCLFIFVFGPAISNNSHFLLPRLNIFRLFSKSSLKIKIKQFNSSKSKKIVLRTIIKTYLAFLYVKLFFIHFWHHTPGTKLTKWFLRDAESIFDIQNHPKWIKCRICALVINFV